MCIRDSYNTVKTLVAILNIKGFQALGAASGKEALEILSQNQISVVLSDVKMPEMNGVELYRAICKTHPSVGVLMMTAYASGHLILEGLTEGIETVLNKPLDIDNLITILHAYPA